MVKNVTGYDLHKLLIGSLGTLAVITRVNFRTFPLPPAQGTFVASFSAAEAAFGFCRAIAHSVLTPQMVEVADPGAAASDFFGEAPARIEPRAWSVDHFGRRPAGGRGSPRARTWPHGRRRGRREFVPLERCRSLPFWRAFANFRG